MKHRLSASEPKDLQELKNMIAARACEFPEQSERVARFALEKPALIAFGTAQSISSACSVAPSTVFRTANALGFTNFSEFRRFFRQHVLASSAAHAVSS
ncbi:MurR/RpiR family transcriptional regulator [Rhizobium sp. Rhizsp42]|uniref:MurR/RpiR family transcriptional regulator n=1 Tax=Rhizobium sp. Rhizsp42 TaxID=3243034 RepID=UPI000DD73F14